MLAALIADGNLTNRTPRFTYGPDSPVLADVERRPRSSACRCATTDAAQRASALRARLAAQPGHGPVQAPRHLAQALGGEVRARADLRAAR